jgi:hypothetical protein
MFYGNGIFRDAQGGNPLLPDNALTQRMRQGIFGPNPNNTAPPNFMVAPSLPNDPAIMAAVLRSGLLPNIAGGAPPPPAPAAPPPKPPEFVVGPGPDWGR